MTCKQMYSKSVNLEAADFSGMETWNYTMLFVLHSIDKLNSQTMPEFREGDVKSTF